MGPAMTSDLDPLTICGCGDQFSEGLPGTCWNCIENMKTELIYKLHTANERIKVLEQALAVIRAAAGDAK